MEAQPPPQPTPPPLSSVLPPPPHLNYPESLDSSPRSRNTDSWDEPYPPLSATTTSNKLRLMVSYGGHISPRPHDKTLCYVGGDTRIVVVDRHTSLSDLTTRLSKTFMSNRPFALKYQLPNEDLDSLISVTTDEDLENMIEEYDQRITNSSSSSKPSRIRLFLFPAKPDGSASGLGSERSEDWFMNVLNGSGFHDLGLSESASVNCLLGLDDEVVAASGNNDGAAAAQPGDGKNLNLKQGQDVHSVPDSPMLETNSSFGSSSSSPSANLAPIKVHVEDGGSTGGGSGVRGQDQKVVEIEEQFTQLGVGGVGQKQDEDIVVLTSPPAPVVAVNVSAVPISPAAAVAGEFLNRVVSDDERSDHGVPVGYRKLPISQPQIQIQTQSQPQVQGLAPQIQQKSSTGVFDLPSPDSVSSDNSLTNAMSRPKPVNVIYQDQVQIQSGASRVPIISVDPNLNVSDPHSPIQMQQHVPDPGYVLQQHQFDQQQEHQQELQQHQFDLQQQHQQALQQHQFDQQQQHRKALQQHQFDQKQQQQHQQALQQHQFDQKQHQQALQQHQFDQKQEQQHQQAFQQHQFDQQQQQQHQQAQQAQQFIHGTHFIQHTPAGPVSIPAYYPVYPSQQQLHPQHPYQLDQQYPVYYVPAGQAQAYNLPVQQANLSESATTVPSSQPQNLPNPAAIVPPSAAYNPMRSAPLPNSEMTGSVYRTAATSTPQLVQVPAGQHQQQYVAYSQIHHPSQSVAPNSAAPANYAYNYADPAHAQIFYAQHLPPTMPSQSRP